LDQEFKKYRTAVTGAAASDKELERILKNFPNYKMSPTEYNSAIKTTAITYWKLAERRKRALLAGVMENDTEAMKNFYKSLPLDRLPDPPEDVIRRFMPKSKFEILEVR